MSVSLYNKNNADLDKAMRGKPKGRGRRGGRGGGRGRGQGKNDSLKNNMLLYLLFQENASFTLKTNYC